MDVNIGYISCDIRTSVTSSMSRARPYVLVPNIAESWAERERERDQFSRPALASVIIQLPGQTRLSSVRG